MPRTKKPTPGAFEQFVKKCAENNSSEIIENISTGHALVLARHLFAAAGRDRETVRIVSGRLLKSFYEELKEAAREALDLGARFKVVVLSDDPTQFRENGFADLVEKHENGEIHVLNKGAESMPHFMVVGESRYRIEVDASRKIARAAFNDDIIAPALVRIHNDAWANSSAS